MPELPEVETIRRQLEKLIVGRTISSIEVLNPGSFRAEKNSFIGETVAGAGRKGKVLILETSPNARLFIHLKMSGRLEMLPRQYARHSRGLRPRVVVSPVPRRVRGAARLRGSGVPADFSNEKSGPVRKMSGQLKFIDQRKSKTIKKARPFSKRPGLSKLKHLRVAIGFTDNSRLLFHDQRKFGWISDDEAALPEGIDALDLSLSSTKLAEIIGSSSRPIKQILLDQSKIAGIGNIYVSEILWEAKINPDSKGPTLALQGRTLKQAIAKILYEAIKYGGSTMNDRLYRQVSGQAGGYWPRRRVYGRAGEPCLRCKTSIIKSTIAQRSTYFCPNCQAG